MHTIFKKYKIVWLILYAVLSHYYRKRKGRNAIFYLVAIKFTAKNSILSDYIASDYIFSCKLDYSNYHQRTCSMS